MGIYETHQATGSPLAEEALCRIGELYRIEAEVRGRPPDERKAARQQRSKPLVEALHAWLTTQLGRVSRHSALAEAIRYAPRHWTGLVLFLEGGQIELDTNVIGRATRPIALGRKIASFAGSDGGARRWAVVASVMTTAKLNGVETLAWPTDVLECMVSGRAKAHELERLLPWPWQIERPAATANAWMRRR
jgi:transposase